MLNSLILSQLNKLLKKKFGTKIDKKDVISLLKNPSPSPKPSPRMKEALDFIDRI